MTVDDTASYPNLIITKIFQDIQSRSPRQPFSIATGDYIFASNSGGQAPMQLDKYLDARANYTNPLFPAMGNHECTGYTTRIAARARRRERTAQYPGTT